MQAFHNLDAAAYNALVEMRKALDAQLDHPSFRRLSVRDRDRALAAEKRRRFDIYGPLLVRYSRAVRKTREEGPVRELPKPEPASQESWDRIIGEINARKEAEGEGA